MTKIVKLLLVVFTLTFALFSCDTANSPVEKPKNPGTVSGTVTIPSSVTNRAWAVLIDSDKDDTNGHIATDGGLVTGTSFSYSFSDIAPGNYFVYAVVWTTSDDGSTPPDTGDYYGIYNPSGSGSPATANVTVASDANTTCNFNVAVLTGGIPTTGTVSGTVTIPSSVTSRPWAVFLDTDTNGDNGFIEMVNGTITGTSINYSISDVAPGTYFVYAVVYAVGDGTGAPVTGDYAGIYNPSGTGMPASANVSASAGSTTTCSFSVALYSAGGGDETGTVSGTVTLPLSVSGKPWVVIVDTDFDGGNGFTAMTSGTVNSSSFSYNIVDVPVGTYCVYSVVYMGTYDEPPFDEEGLSFPENTDYVAMYGATDMEAIVDATLNVTVASDVTSTCNMTAFFFDQSYFTGGGGGGDYSVSGTITLPASVTNKTAMVALNTALTAEGETVAYTFVTGITGASFNYTIEEVPSGSYYIVGMVFIDENDIEAGALYGGLYMPTGYPSSPNLVVTDSNLTGCNFSLSAQE